MIRALAVFAPTLLFIFVRPGRIKEVWFAAAGALLAWLLGLVSPDDAISLLRETGDVLLFLAGMLVVAYVTDRAGVFERLALWTARAARGRGRLLFAGVYLIGVLVTVWLSLDTTAVILAPIVFSLARALDIPPLPFVFATTYVANTASLFLPVSNLTNLIVLGRLSIPFWEYARVMFLPGLLAVVVNLLLLFWLFRALIPKAYDVRRAERFEYGVVAAGGEGVGHGVYGGAAADVSLPAEEPATKSRECVAVTVAGLLAVLAGLAGAPFWGIGLWVPACRGDRGPRRVPHDPGGPQAPRPGERRLLGPASLCVLPLPAPQRRRPRGLVPVGGGARRRLGLRRELRGAPGRGPRPPPWAPTSSTTCRWCWSRWKALRGAHRGGSACTGPAFTPP